SRLDPIPGQPPMPLALPRGCAFEPRCAVGSGRPRCREEDPALRAITERQEAACHYVEERPVPAAAQIPARSRIADSTAQPLLKIEGLKVHFPIRSGILRRTTGWVRAVDGVDLAIRAGETVSLVGESGCGKTTIGRTVMGLVPATAGDIRFEGRSI